VCVCVCVSEPPGARAEFGRARFPAGKDRVFVCFPLSSLLPLFHTSFRLGRNAPRAVTHHAHAPRPRTTTPHPTPAMSSELPVKWSEDLVDEAGAPMSKT